VGDAELDVEIPAAAQVVDRVAILRRALLGCHVVRELKSRHSIQEASLVAEQAVQSRRLDACGSG
jgi:hypothetical protein